MAASMKTQILEAKLVEISHNASYNPLHLMVGKVPWSILNLGTGESTGFVALSSSPDQFSSKNVLATAALVDSTLDFEATSSSGVVFGGQVILTCTRQFLEHYGFQTNSTIYVKNVDILPLNKIVIACKSHKSYEWAKSQAFSVGLLCSVCQEKTLCRKKDKLLCSIPSAFQDNLAKFYELWQDLEVVDCDPVHQGYLTVKTEIIISQASYVSSPNDAQLQIEEPRSAVIVSDFLSSQLLNNLGTEEPLLELHNQCSEICLPFIIQQTTKDDPFDPLVEQNYIYISECAASEYGLFQDALVDVILLSRDEELDVRLSSQMSLEEIAISNAPKANWKKHARNGSIIEGKPKKSKWRKCHVAKVKIDENAQSECIPNGQLSNLQQVSVTPSLYFHISKQQMHRSLQKLVLRKHERITDESLSASSSWYSELPYATEVHVSVVFSPNYSSGGSFGQAIQKFFQTQRMVKKGDVLCVPTEVDVDYRQDLFEGTTTRQPVIYFYVRKVLPKIKHQHSYIVDAKHTNLYQDGTDHSFVPLAMDNWLNPRCCVSPVGLESYIERVSSIFEPHISFRNFCEELTPSVLLTGPAGCGKFIVCQQVAASLHLHLFTVNCFELVGETSAATEARIKHQLQRACSYAPCLLLLKNVHVIGKERDGSSEDSRVAENFHRAIESLSKDSPDWPIVIVASSPAPKLLTSDIHEGFLHHVEMKVPDELIRREIISSFLSNTTCASDVSVKHIAQRTAGMVLGDLTTLVMQAKRFAYSRSIKMCLSRHGISAAEEKDIELAGPVLLQSDVNAALDQLQAAHSDAIGAPKIPNVTWDDVGGLVKVKADILDTIQLPLQHPELLSAGLRRSGVLLYGPPGTGKTLLAKAVATECSLNFLSVKGPELINMYVGQSEENIREVFGRARSASPCVIFFDELDSLAPNRGRSGDSGGVMDRVVSQLLAELDGLHKSCDVFVIGATNRPDLLDPALLRPGRFDKLLYLGVSEDRESQFRIIKALTRKFALQSGCSLQNVVEKCPYNMTGADFYALCSDAMLNAMKRKIALLDAGKATDEGGVVVSEDDFMNALSYLVPSVSLAELNHYKSLQSQFTHST